MRVILAACSLLLCMQEAQAQVQRQQLGVGSLTEIRIPVPVQRTQILPPAPFGRLYVKSWHFNPAAKYPISLDDTAGFTWFVAFESNGEHFDQAPATIEGWFMIIDGGCLRIGTRSGSYLLGSKEAKGKGIPASFEILNPPKKEVLSNREP